MADALKDAFDVALVEDLADRLKAASPDTFDRSHFLTEILPTLSELELKARINLIADAIASSFDGGYVPTLDAVVATSQTDIDAWSGWALCSFVERHGLGHPEQSLTAMETLTQLMSCEFAIRPFLEHHLELTRTYLRQWAVSPNEHVRRLPSEGTRPILPWGPKVQALNEDPAIGLELLTILRLDESETVRRSVANHLNDIAKADPDLVVRTLTDWTSRTPPADPKMVRHALRTLVKNGDPGALELLGFTTDPQVTVGSFTCSPDVIELGNHIELETVIRSTGPEPQKLVVDFVVHHQNARGDTSPKVFKWTTITLEPNEERTLSKRRLIQHASTRTYHPGVHKVDLQIAGHPLASTQFTI